MHDTLRDRTRRQDGTGARPLRPSTRETLPAADTVPDPVAGGTARKEQTAANDTSGVDVNRLLLAVVVTAASVPPAAPP